MDKGHRLGDPLAAAVTALAADDMAYWIAHPELQGLVAHFMVKVLEQRPSDTQAFARETFGHQNLKEQVRQAIARNGGLFNGEQQTQQQKASGAASGSRGRHGGGGSGSGGKERMHSSRDKRDKSSSRDKSSRDKSSRDKNSRDKSSREKSSRDKR